MSQPRLFRADSVTTQTRSTGAAKVRVGMSAASEGPKMIPGIPSPSAATRTPIRPIFLVVTVP